MNVWKAFFTFMEHFAVALSLYPATRGLAHILVRKFFQDSQTGLAMWLEGASENSDLRKRMGLGTEGYNPPEFRFAFEALCSFLRCSVNLESLVGLKIASGPHNLIKSWQSNYLGKKRVAETIMNCFQLFNFRNLFKILHCVPECHQVNRYPAFSSIRRNLVYFIGGMIESAFPADVRNVLAKQQWLRYIVNGLCGDDPDVLEYALDLLCTKVFSAEEISYKKLKKVLDDGGFHEVSREL